jgi:hypothetical protein
MPPPKPGWGYRKTRRCCPKVLLVTVSVPPVKLRMPPPKVAGCEKVLLVAVSVLRL